MSNRFNLLNPKQLSALPIGKHKDAPNFFYVVEADRRFFLFRWTDRTGKDSAIRMIETGLAEARKKAVEYRGMIQDGQDPRVAKQLAKGGKRFIDFAEETYPDWCVGKHHDEENGWKRSIKSVPSLHDMLLHEIESQHVYEALKKLWFTKTVSAARTRQRLQRLFGAAKALKLRTGENPAAWDDNLEHLLPPVNEIHTVKHLASVPYADVPKAMTGFSYDETMLARLLEFTVLVAGRSQETRGMEWTELKLDKGIWIVPAARMKAIRTAKKKPHTVVLSQQAMDLLRALPNFMKGRYVFPSPATGEPYLRQTVMEGLDRHGLSDFTVHGFRASFRQFGAEDTREFAYDVLECCIAHKVAKNDAEEAYLRSAEMVDRRRKVMQAWADFVRPTNVIKLRRVA